MKVLLPEGNEIEGDIVTMSTGYVADKIRLEERDVQCMLDMLERDPNKLRSVLLQLRNRYPINRVGGIRTGDDK